jgi:hypothetical protein
MLRVFFDTNNKDHLGRYALNFDTSLFDFSNSEIPPYDGMTVVLYMPWEVECLATLIHDSIWWGIPISKSYKLYDEESKTYI